MRYRSLTIEDIGAENDMLQVDIFYLRDSYSKEKMELNSHISTFSLVNTSKIGFSFLIRLKMLRFLLLICGLC